MNNMKTLISRSSFLSSANALAFSAAGASHRHASEEKRQWSWEMMTLANGAVASK